MGRQYLRLHLFPSSNMLTAIPIVLMEAVLPAARAVAVPVEVPVAVPAVVVVVGETEVLRVIMYHCNCLS